MSRALLCLTLSTRAPALTGGGGPTRLSPFGRWLHHHVVGMSREWPALGFDRLRFDGNQVRIALAAPHVAPVLAAALLVARGLIARTESLARESGWMGEGEPLWNREATQVWVVRGPALKLGPTGRSPSRRTR